MTAQRVTRRNHAGSNANRAVQFADETYNLRIELDCHHFEPPSEMIEAFESGLAPLRVQTERFPVSDLYITIMRHERMLGYHVKTALVLPGATMATSEADRYVHTAFEQCVRKLVRRTKAHIAALEAEGDLAKHRKGTRHDVTPNREPDDATLAEATAEGDYGTFRQALYVFEEPVRKRIGRLVQRHPDAEQRIGVDFTIADMVEEVFLNAFEQWGDRPPNVPVGTWLEQLIEPSIALLTARTDEELQNISYIRMTREADRQTNAGDVQ